MCGGIAFKISKIPKAELDKFYSELEIVDQIKKDQAQSYFWSKRPVLPIEDSNRNIKLYDWGNRSEEVKLPKTGWAKQESIEQGWWQQYKPKFVTIPAEKGYEKGVWFDLSGRGFEGIAVKDKKDERVYMITKPASQEYKNLTHHDREPIEVK